MPSRKEDAIPGAETVTESDELYINIRELLHKRTLHESQQYSEYAAHAYPNEEYVVSSPWAEVSLDDMKEIVGAASRRYHDMVKLYCDPLKKRTIKDISALMGTSSMGTIILDQFQREARNSLRKLLAHGNILPMNAAEDIDRNGCRRLIGALSDMNILKCTEVTMDEVEEICKKSRRELSKRKNLGKKSLNQLEEILSRWGLRLSPDLRETKPPMPISIVHAKSLLRRLAKQYSIKEIKSMLREVHLEGN